MPSPCCCSCGPGARLGALLALRPPPTAAEVLDAASDACCQVIADDWSTLSHSCYLLAMVDDVPPSRKGLM